MAENTHTQKQYDHRLRRLIQNTGDLELAVRYGVPRSTARGWLKQFRIPVIVAKEFFAVTTGPLITVCR